MAEVMEETEGERYQSLLEKKCLGRPRHRGTDERTREERNPSKPESWARLAECRQTVPPWFWFDCLVCVSSSSVSFPHIFTGSSD